MFAKQFSILILYKHEIFPTFSRAGNAFTKFPTFPDRGNPVDFSRSQALLISKFYKRNVGDV